MNKTKCDLTDEELISKCNIWISNLCRTGGRAWMLNVPVDFNNDPDMLFSELINRYVIKYRAASAESQPAIIQQPLCASEVKLPTLKDIDSFLHDKTGVGIGKDEKALVNYVLECVGNFIKRQPLVESLPNY